MTVWVEDLLNNVVVVPNIHLRDLTVGERERLGTVPSDI